MIIFTKIKRYNRHIFPPCIVLVVLLLAQYHLKCNFKEPTIRHSHHFPNVPSHEWHSWKVNYGSSILSGKIVQQEMIEILCDDSAGWKEAVNNDDIPQKQTSTNV